MKLQGSRDWLFSQILVATIMVPSFCNQHKTAIFEEGVYGVGDGCYSNMFIFDSALKSTEF